MTYELTFLLNEEEELKKISELITSLSGKVIKEDKWGEKALFFPIKKANKAVFYCWALEMETKKMAEFKRKLNFNEKILRYLLLEKAGE
ncbi:30S ribosomal protein S6 [Candidatus Roizmanbacteria bacterium]|jgi:ribosomal protein S6|nr:30S ribosomal protein S6 [Candidatus Roizmanbacteria bacterium]